MNGAKPTGITANRQLGQLSIDWEEGHTSVYTFSLLRHACPCAECRGGHDKMGYVPSEVFFMAEEDTPATHLKTIEPVGTYAITIEWEDGHHYCIYHWQYLRDLCPCQACRGGMPTYGR